MGSPVKIKASASWNEGARARVKARMIAAGKAIREQRVTVGVAESEGDQIKRGYKGEDSNISLIDAMLAHEFGRVPGVPERSWFRSWFDLSAERLRREMVAAKRSEFKGDKGAVDRVAVQWAEELRAWVSADQANLEPLAESTVKRRESAGLEAGPPLLATGQFVAAIKAVVDGRTVGP